MPYAPHAGHAENEREHPLPRRTRERFPVALSAVDSAGILADAYQFSGEDLRRRRAESVNNVKKTNGRISLEQRVRDAWEEDDEWQD